MKSIKALMTEIYKNEVNRELMKKHGIDTRPFAERIKEAKAEMRKIVDKLETTEDPHDRHKLKMKYEVLEARIEEFENLADSLKGAPK